MADRRRHKLSRPSGGGCFLNLTASSEGGDEGDGFASSLGAEDASAPSDGGILQ